MTRDFIFGSSEHKHADTKTGVVAGIKHVRIYTYTYAQVHHRIILSDTHLMVCTSLNTPNVEHAPTDENEAQMHFSF